MTLQAADYIVEKYGTVWDIVNTVGNSFFNSIYFGFLILTCTSGIK